MKEVFEIDGIKVRVSQKPVKNLSLRVKPPNGMVDLTAPESVSFDVARAFVISRMPWIRKQREVLETQERMPVRRYVERETHFVWGRRCMLEVEETPNSKPHILLDHTRLRLVIGPGSTLGERRRVMEKWQRQQLHEIVPGLIKKWELKLQVEVAGYLIQRMKTKWGSCNPQTKSIRLNLELTQRPKDILEYVVVHEMAHLIEPTHGPAFQSLMDLHLPAWRDLQSELNSLPLPDEMWRDKKDMAEIAEENAFAGC